MTQIKSTEELMTQRVKSKSDAEWSIDNEPVYDGEWSRQRDLIHQSTTHIAEIEFEAEEHLQAVGKECVGAYGDGGHARMNYIVNLHNSLPTINKRMAAYAELERVCREIVGKLENDGHHMGRENSIAQDLSAALGHEDLET